jgi:hypothetical protein
MPTSEFISLNSLTSEICHLPFVIRRLSSVLRHLTPSTDFKIQHLVYDPSLSLIKAFIVQSEFSKECALYYR